MAKLTNTSGKTYAQTEYPSSTSTPCTSNVFRQNKSRKIRVPALPYSVLPRMFLTTCFLRGFPCTLCLLQPLSGGQDGAASRSVGGKAFSHDLPLVVTDLGKRRRRSAWARVHVGFRFSPACNDHHAIAFERINQRNPTINDAQPNLRIKRPSPIRYNRIFLNTKARSAKAGVPIFDRCANER